MKINKILETSLVDGNGVRLVLFVQGCSKKCFNCHNEQAQDFKSGIFMNVSDVKKLIEEKSINKKITISGGEPLEQYDELIELIKLLKKDNFDICIYTGWLLNEIPQEIYQYIDYIKVGQFIEDLKDVELRYVGSKNQKMFKVIREEKLCLKEI